MWDGVDLVGMVVTMSHQYYISVAKSSFRTGGDDVFDSSDL